ncbi:MAG: vWA domain-containing protein [Trueperaceae bacterium]
MKKFSRLLWLVVLLFVLFLSACGEGETTSTSPDGGTSGPPYNGGDDGGAKPSEPIAEAPSDITEGGGGDVSSGGDGEEPVQSGTLTAGDVDDNLNFASFQTYLNNVQQSLAQQQLPAISLSDGVSIRVLDGAGVAISNAKVKVFAGDSQTPLLETTGGANGVFQFFPAFDGAAEAKTFRLEFRPADADSPVATLNLDLVQPLVQPIEVKLEDFTTTAPQALDFMLVMDATGSMGDEMQYLTTEFRDIVTTIKTQFPNVSTRFGLIVYRDEGDDYVVRSFDFTDSVETMQQQLSQQTAAGGGDYPEAMDQAMERVNQAQWRGGNTARLVFLVADAPPHTKNASKALNAAKTARRLGLHYYPLAASGVADEAEYLMRLTAATTHGRYLFLTDDSGVGNPHAEPKIPCYQVTRLDQLMIRVISSELSGARVEAEPAQIIREIGQQQGGVCQAQQ